MCFGLPCRADAGSLPRTRSIRGIELCLALALNCVCRGWPGTIAAVDAKRRARPRCRVVTGRVLGVPNGER